MGSLFVKRRWMVGMTWETAGMRFRVVTGRKADDDLVLEWETPTGWQHVNLRVAAQINDFFYDNEDALHPPTSGFKGGEKYRAFIHVACNHGWETAEERNEYERSLPRQGSLI